MAFFDDMRDMVSQAGHSTVQKAKDLSDTAKLNGVISESKSKINELYKKIGYQVYCGYEQNPIPEIAELVEEVSTLHTRINDSELKIKAINAEKSCPQCGNRVNKSMAFCSGCGYKLSVEEQSTEETAIAFCSECGAAISDGEKFCMACGAKIESE